MLTVTCHTLGLLRVLTPSYLSPGSLPQPLPHSAPRAVTFAEAVDEFVYDVLISKARFFRLLAPLSLGFGNRVLLRGGRDQLGSPRAAQH